MVQELVRENRELKDLLQNLMQALSRGDLPPLCPNLAQTTVRPVVNLPAAGEELGGARPTTVNVHVPVAEFHLNHSHPSPTSVGNDAISQWTLIEQLIESKMAEHDE